MLTAQEVKRISCPPEKMQIKKSDGNGLSLIQWANPMDGRRERKRASNPEDRAFGVTALKWWKQQKDSRSSEHASRIRRRLHGIELSRKTMASSMMRSADLSEPVIDRLRQIQLQQSVINADETPLKVIHEDKNQCYMRKPNPYSKHSKYGWINRPYKYRPNQRLAKPLATA